ncbi:hypothetical protein BT93_D0819 [Corymbia citriodora subsp. variegata]|nr:hypothetical protein BT93_D0819 [Corymbia citriodora subsp. variegata]
MQVHRAPPHLLAALLLLLAATSSSPARAQNITRLLAGHPDFSTFNHYLSVTHLAAEINSRTTITVLAVSNAAMNDLLAEHPTTATLKNILSLHVLLDYFGSKKLHQLTDGFALAATLFQSTGSAPGSSGFVNITDLTGGKVGFVPEEGGSSDVGAYYVKSLDEVPYNISVIQISKVLPSAIAAAPAPEPSQVNVTDVMAAHGCKEFADALSNSSDALKTYEDNVVGGLTVFCPLDDAFKTFRPKFNNLSAANRSSFLEFFGVPVYMSMSMLRSNNGLMNTLATDGSRKFDFTVQNDGQDVTLKTKVNTAKITGTLLDEQPLAIYTLDKVLLPQELFKEAVSPAPAPAPTPEKAAESPKAAVKHKSPPAPPTSAASDAPADSPDGTVADQTANASARIFCGRFGFMAMSLLLVVLAL